MINTNETDIASSGIGIDKHTKRLTEYTTKTTKVCLIKDASKPEGFAIVTAFPSLTRNATPTGRNISHLIKDTELYQNASKIEQVGMDIANDPLFDPKTMNIRTTKDKIQLQEQPCESEITYEAVTYLPDETQVRTTKPKLYQLAKNAAKELGIKTPIKDIIKNAIKEAITKVTEKVIKRKPKDTTPPDEIRSRPETQTKKPEPDTDDPNDKQEHEKETIETRSAPRIFSNSNNMINPEDDIELYENLKPYDPLGHNTDPEHIEYMQKLRRKANPQHNDHTQVPEGKYNLPDNNKELMDELNQSVERMEKRTKDGKYGLGE